MHGWILVAIRGEERDAAFEASDVPVDSIRMFAEVARDIAAGSDGGEVSWFMEPGEKTWAFRRNGDMVSIWIRSHEEPASCIATEHVENLCLSIWSALCHLQEDPIWAIDADCRIWSHPFPAAVVARLGSILGCERGAG